MKLYMVTILAIENKARCSLPREPWSVPARLELQQINTVLPDRGPQATRQGWAGAEGLVLCVCRGTFRDGYLSPFQKG